MCAGSTKEIDDLHDGRQPRSALGAIVWIGIWKVGVSDATGLVGETVREPIPAQVSVRDLLGRAAGERRPDRRTLPSPIPGAGTNAESARVVDSGGRSCRGSGRWRFLRRSTCRGFARRATPAAMHQTGGGTSALSAAGDLSGICSVSGCRVEGGSAESLTGPSPIWSPRPGSAAEHVPR